MGKIRIQNETATPATPSTGNSIIYVENNQLKSVGSDGLTRVYSTGITPEEVQDIVASLVQAGSGISVVYDDPNNSLTISSTITQYTDEQAQDAIAAALLNSSTVQFVYDDVNNHITANVLPAGIAHQSLSGAGTNTHAQIDSHIASTSNPHATTYTQVGADVAGAAATAQAYSIQRANHTGTQLSSTISDFTTAAQSANSAAIALKADKVTTISAGSGLTGGGDLSTNRTLAMPNVGTAGTYGSATNVPVLTTDTQGRVSGVTNTPIQIPESQVTNLVTDLAGKEPANSNIQAHIASTSNPHSTTAAQVGADVLGAASSAQAFAIQRANHTGTQLSTTISDFAEATDDRVAALLQPGTGITLTYNDPSNTLTVASTITQYTDEQAQDAVGNILTDSSSVDLTYNDTANTISATVLPAGVDHNSLLNVDSSNAHNEATTLVPGFMSTTDKAKLDGITNDVFYHTTAQLNNSSNSVFVNISNLTIPIAIGGYYKFQIMLRYRSAATGTGIVVAFTTTGGATGTLSAVTIANTTTTSGTILPMKALNTATTFTATPAVNTDYICRIDGIFNCSGASGTPLTLIPQFRSESNGTQVSVMIGSTCEVRSY